MNQILSTTTSQKKDKKRKEKNSNNANRNYDANIMKRAVIIFSILLIVFAIVIISVKLVQTIKNNSQNNKIAELNKPEIKIEIVSEDKVNINISYDESITKLTWWWNNDISQIEERNRDVKQVSITVPDGETNILHVEVIGADGSTNSIEETITRDLTTTIEMNQIPESDNMEIIARSENGIEKLVYYWNDEQAIVVPATENNQEELRTTIQLKRGTNTLHAIVTDNDGNTEEKKEMFHCVKEPEITVEANIDQMIVVITVSHDMGLSLIEFEINGRQITYDENYRTYDPTKTKLTFTASLKPGMVNTVKITAYSNEKFDDTENTSATYSGEADLTEMNVNTEEE